MASKIKKTITKVRSHLRHVPPTKNNPTGITIVREHFRHLNRKSLSGEDIHSIFKNYERKNLTYPTSKKLLDEYKNSDSYDDLIAIWTDYFNKKFDADPLLDPDVVKALIASESRFQPDPPGNPLAFGIAQITQETLKILQDPKGEAKNFIFNNISQEDLKNPAIGIPMAVRWLFRKKQTAAYALKRQPNTEELILEYKGLLYSKTLYKNNALKNFIKNYAKLKKK